MEDNEDHALITEMAIRDAQPEVAEQLVVDTVTDGAEALAYLRGEGLYAGNRLPDLVLLDMKMPGVDGLDVLRAVRADLRLRTVPVVMLTTSAQGEDVLEAYREGANEYVTKPVRAEEFRTKVQAIPRYWTQVVQRPSVSPE
ncbi:MAG: response regulator [Chloroflexota bacterium]